MKITQERLEGSRIALVVEVDPEQVVKSTDHAFQKLGSQVAVPGFRRGKAPRHILKSYVGDQRVRQETFDDLLPIAYKQALDDTGIQPIADPELELLNSNPEQPVTFKATIPVSPTIQLGDYRSVRVEPQSTDVSDAQVEVAIENLRKQHSTWEAVTDRPVEIGDEVTADIQGDAEGQRIIDLHDQAVVVAENGLPKDVDEGLVGLSAGEERVVVGTLAENYPEPALAGKEATYSITVKSIRQRILPPLDDELAQKVPNVTNVEELRQELRRQLEASVTQAERNRQESTAIDAVLALSTLDYPHVLVDRQVDRMMETFATNVSRQGFDPSRYIQMIGLTPQELRERWHPEAEAIVRRELILEEVAKAEALEPSEDEVTQEIKRILEVDDAQLSGLLERNPRLNDAVRASARQRMALDRLVQLAVATSNGETTTAEPETEIAAPADDEDKRPIEALAIDADAAAPAPDEPRE